MKSRKSKTVFKQAIATLAALLTAGFMLASPMVATAHSGRVLPADPGHDDQQTSDEADPKLQQVVSDDEKQDLASDATIEEGHVDLGPKIIDGKWRLVARDDSSAPPTWRDLNKIVFYLPKEALQALPKGDEYSFTGAKGGDSVYTIPQTEIAGVPWLGWSTQSPAVVQQVDGQIQLTYEGHQGEGDFTNFLQAGLGGSPQVLWSSKTKNAQTINVDVNTHTHTNWIFTKPGVHLIRITASATLKDGKKVTETALMRFAVGEKKYIEQARKAQWTQQQTDPKAQAKVTDLGNSSDKESKILVWIIGGVLLAVGIIGAIVAFVILRRAQREREAAIAKRGQNSQFPSWSKHNPSDQAEAAAGTDLAEAAAADQAQSLAAADQAAGPDLKEN